MIRFALAGQVKVTFWLLEVAFPSCVALGKRGPFLCLSFLVCDRKMLGLSTSYGRVAN